MKKDLVPRLYQPYRSWEWGLQIVNYKKLTQSYQANQMNSDHTFRSMVIASFYL